VKGEDSPPILSEEKADGRFWLIVWRYACREWPLALRGLLSREGRAEAEQNRGGNSRESEVEESGGGRSC
jgi:hypothetical protein